MEQPYRPLLTWRGSPVSRRSVLLGAGAVAAFLAVDLGTMAYANNWIKPRDLTRQSFIDAFRTVFGVHPGFRANHAKGVAVTGYFDSNGNAAGLSHAAVFRSGRVAQRSRALELVLAVGAANDPIDPTPWSAFT